MGWWAASCEIGWMFTRKKWWIEWLLICLHYTEPKLCWLSIVCMIHADIAWADYTTQRNWSSKPKLRLLTKIKTWAALNGNYLQFVETSVIWVQSNEEKLNIYRVSFGCWIVQFLFQILSMLLLIWFHNSPESAQLWTEVRRSFRWRHFAPTITITIC